MIESVCVERSKKSESTFEIFLKHKHLYQTESFKRYVSTVDQYDTADPLGIYTNNQFEINVIYVLVSSK
jgi:hypothetical protein